MTASPEEPARQRLFVSYRHGSETSPQEGIIRRLNERLLTRHDIFTDKSILPGDRWGAQIEQEIAICDIFIPLLTVEAMWSEMVIDEVARAHRLRRVAPDVPGSCLSESGTDRTSLTRSAPISIWFSGSTGNRTRTQMTFSLLLKPFLPV